jgi:hypothetical protein
MEKVQSDHHAERMNQVNTVGIFRSVMTGLNQPPRDGDGVAVGQQSGTVDSNRCHLIREQRPDGEIARTKEEKQQQEIQNRFEIQRPHDAQDVAWTGRCLARSHSPALADATPNS